MSMSSDATAPWSITDVYLLTDGNDGRVAVPSLRLTFSDVGVALTKSTDELVWTCPWSELREISTAERSVIPDGTEGLVVILAERTGGRHRFVLPTNEPAELEVQLRHLALHRRLQTNRPPRAASRALTALVVLGTGATLAALLLAAAHVFQF
jgi:hypothetical protein